MRTVDLSGNSDVIQNSFEIRIVEEMGGEGEGGEGGVVLSGKGMGVKRQWVGEIKRLAREMMVKKMSGG